MRSGLRLWRPVSTELDMDSRPRIEGIVQTGSIAPCRQDPWTEAGRLGLSAHRMGRIKIIFTDGSSQEFAPTDQRQICDGAVLIRPARIPADLDLVWDNPPIYSKYVVVTCDLIQPGHYIRTAT